MKYFLLIGLLALPVQAANVVTTPLSGVRVYPNPWRVDKHATMPVKFDGIPAASTVKLFTVSGHEVKTVSADSNGVAVWYTTNEQGDSVASGVYIYLIIGPQGDEASGKLAIIK